MRHCYAVSWMARAFDDHAMPGMRTHCDHAESSLGIRGRPRSILAGSLDRSIASEERSQHALVPPSIG